MEILEESVMMTDTPTITPEQREALARTACESRGKAYAPYSNYHVGAAALGESGLIYSGANIENAAYSPTICAERLAIFKAVEAGERRIAAVAVCTDEGATPCGPCRQVMLEFGPEMTVLVVDAAGEHRETSLPALLPDAFRPENVS